MYLLEGAVEHRSSFVEEILSPGEVLKGVHHPENARGGVPRLCPAAQLLAPPGRAPKKSQTTRFRLIVPQDRMGSGARVGEGGVGDGAVMGGCGKGGDMRTLVTTPRVGRRLEGRR